MLKRLLWLALLLPSVAFGQVHQCGNIVVGNVAVWAPAGNGCAAGSIKDGGPGAIILPGLANDLAFYATNGSTISPLATNPNSVLTTPASGVPALTQYLSLPNSPSFVTSPTGNPTGGSLLGTYSTVAVQGGTQNPGNREFLVNIGLNSTQGAGVSNNNGDKVALYIGATGQPGTGDLWAFNPLLAQEAGSGSYNAQVIENDLNNFDTDKGGSDGISGYPSKVAVGISVSGINDANNYQNTSDFVADSFNFNAAGSLFAHGFVCNGFFKFNCIASYAQQPTFIADFGGGVYGIDLYSAVLSGGGIRLPTNPTGGIIGRNTANTADVPLIRFDGTNSFLCGTGCAAVEVGGPLLPLTTMTYDIGAISEVWEHGYFHQIGVGTTAITSTISDGGTLGVSGTAAFGSAVAIAGSFQLTGLTGGTPVTNLCQDASNLVVTCSGGSGAVSSVAAGSSGNLTASPTTGAVIVDLVASPKGLTSLGVGTSTITSTITDNGTLAVSSTAAFASAVDIAGALELNGLASGTASDYLCITSAFQVVEQTAACVGAGSGVSSVTAGASGNLTISPTTGAVVADLVASPKGLTSIGIGTSSITSTLTLNGTMGVSGASSFNSSVDIAGALELNGLAGGTAADFLCLTSAFQVISQTGPCANSGLVSSIVAGTNISVSGATGAVTVNLVASPNGLTSIGVGTGTITSTISDGGSLGVAGAAAFGSSVSMTGSVQLSGLTTGTATNGLCLNSSNQAIKCGVGGVTSVTAGNADVVISPTTGAVVVTPALNPTYTTLNVGTLTNSQTLTDGGSLGVQGPVNFSGLATGVSVHNICINSSNNLILC